MLNEMKKKLTNEYIQEVCTPKRIHLQPAYFFNCSQRKRYALKKQKKLFFLFSTLGKKFSSAMSFFTQQFNHSGGGAGQIPHQPTDALYKRLINRNGSIYGNLSAQVKTLASAQNWHSLWCTGPLRDATIQNVCADTHISLF